VRRVGEILCRGDVPATKGCDETMPSRKRSGPVEGGICEWCRREESVTTQESCDEGIQDLGWTWRLCQRCMEQQEEVQTLAFVREKANQALRHCTSQHRVFVSVSICDRQERRVAGQQYNDVPDNHTV